MMDNIFPKLHKEGYKFLAISIIITFIVWLFSNFLATIMLLITVWVYYFFRDPDRISINDNSYLVSPADGLITDISEINGPEELGLENKKYTRITNSTFSGPCVLCFGVQAALAHRTFIAVELQPKEHIRFRHHFSNANLLKSS